MSRRNWYLLTNSLVLLWIALAIVATIIHRFVAQPLWLMVHVPLLGAATAAILVWSQHFADTVLRRTGPSGRIGLGIRLALHTVGVSLVIAGMLGSGLLLTLAGALLVGCAIVAHAVILMLQIRGALPTRFAPMVWYAVAASIVFLAGIAAAIAMVLAVDPALVERLAMSHLVLGVFGWIGLTALGILSLLWPTVLRTQLSAGAGASVRFALPVLLVGLAVAAAGPLLGIPAVLALGLVLWLVGAVRLAVEAWREARTAPPRSFAAWSLAAAFVWALLSAVALGATALLAEDWGSLKDDTLLVLGPLGAGFVMQLVMGALSHLVPVVIIGSPSSSAAAAAVLDRGAAFRVFAFNGAIALYVLPMPSIVRVLLAALAAGVVTAFVVLAIRAIVASRRMLREELAAGAAGRAERIAARRAEPPRATPRRAGGVTAAFTVLALCVAGGVAADPVAAGISAVSPGEGVAASGQVTRVTVQVTGMRFDTDVIEVPYGNRLEVTFENTGTDVHDLTFENGARTQRLAPGESETIDVGVIGADMAGWCTVAGHRQMGMELSVVVTGAPDGGGEASTGGAGTAGEHAGGHEAAGAGDAAADIDWQREPAAGFTAWPALLAPAPEGTVHAITLRAEESVEEVAPGITQARWTFGGSAPGPTLRGKIGDVFEITLINDGTIGHSIDFHAGALAPDEPMRTIAPGESLVYRFTATRAGIWMYHCSTMPMSMHIANGMFGAVIIDPPGLAPVAAEYVLVQGELYLGAQGDVANAEKIAEERPDLVAFNGYADQYLHQPLTATAGERVRVWVLDAGPNRPSSFHVIGGQFDTVYLEGAYRLLPDDPGGSQALGLQPAQGGFVELVFPEAGNYPFVTHRMSDAEKGARGVFRVGDPGAAG
ncbi:MAG: multicopper oxidase domain-containing protein [Microbacteriaceae bacterium]|nr:multicopper oxidase domain-containing protein [Microbacteriaceae bacterium]